MVFSNRRILFPVDFSNYPFTVPPAVEALIDDGPNVEVILLHVLDALRPSASKLASRMGELELLARRHFRHCRFRRRVEYGQPAGRILDYIRNNDIRMAVMPARDSGAFSKGPLGHVASQVLAEASCPLWLEWRSRASNNGEPSAPSICCAVEGTPPDEQIVRESAAVADQLGGKLTIISLVTPEANRYAAAPRSPFTHKPEIQRETGRINKLRALLAPRAEVIVATGWREAVIGRALKDRRADLLIIGDCKSAVLAAEGTCPVLRLNTQPGDVSYFGSPGPRDHRRIA